MLIPASRLRWSGALVAIAALSAAPTVSSDSQVDLGASVTEFEMVACLLPARIRKIGNLTYPERRRLVETTGKECNLRGGEYTAYDRSKPESSVSFFKKLADEGDLEAQVQLGDAYQYLFSPPRYAEAAQWYKKAADAGNNNGMMQLARLYERGLGVPQDEMLAVNLWRQATGAGEELVLASELEAARTEADARIARLTEQLQTRSEEAEAVRGQLVAARQELSDRRSSLVAAEQALAVLQQRVREQTAAASNPEEVAQMRAQIVEQQSTIDDQRFQIESMEGDLGVKEAQLTANLRQVEAQNKRLTAELERVNSNADDALQNALADLDAKDQQISELSRELASTRAAVQDGDGAYKALVAQLDSARAEAGEGRAAQRRVAELEAAQSEQEQALAAKRAELKDVEEQLAAVTSDANELRATLDNQVHETAKARAEFAKVEAELQSAREQTDRLRAELDEANTRLVGLTTERDTLKAQLANADTGSEETRSLQLALAEQEERLLAQQLDIQKLQSQVEDYAAELVEIQLRRQSYATRTPIEDTSGVRLPRGVKLGKYRSLVIGNQDYDLLTDLQNAHNDARTVHQILEKEYGFNSNLVLDGDLRQIGQAVLGLVADSSEDDLVLIYYAGHGMRTRDQSYWLPVDIKSRDEAPATGISSDMVARWIKKIPAKHVMIIADSCYSGAGIETAGGFKYSAKDLEVMLPFLMGSRSRTMLTSGGDEPVMDGGGEGQHSVFTRELIGLLRENKGVLHGEALYSYMLERVKYTVDGVLINQTPTFGSIGQAGHESGQFVFVHRGVRS